MHVGHLAYLQQARMLGNVLVVAINTDEAVRKRKGELRPIYADEDRMKLIAAFESVDYVTWYDELTPVGVIKALRPDFFVTSHTSYISSQERAEIEKCTKIILNPKEGDASTTELVEKILNTYGQVRQNP